MPRTSTEATNKTTKAATAKAAAAKATATTAAPRRRRTRATSPSHDQIAERAYYLSIESDVGELGNWLRAERELTA